MSEELSEQEKLLRQRFFVAGLVRLSGVFILMFGFLILMERFDWIQGSGARITGALISVIGLFQTLVFPRLLLRAFRSPKDK